MIELLKNSQKLQDIKQLLKEGHHLLLEELFDSSKAALCSFAAHHLNKGLLVLTHRHFQENLFYYDLKNFSNQEVFDLPSVEVFPSEQIKPSIDLMGERFNTLKQLHKSSQPLVITSLQALLQKMPPPCSFDKSYISLQVDDNLDIDYFIQQLEKLGYERLALVQDKGEFAVRGSIVDIFPSNTPSPYRIEFFDEKIESLRSFDPSSQKSIEKHHSLQVMPADEQRLLQDSKQVTSLLDHLPKDLIVVFDLPEELEDKSLQLQKELKENKKTFFQMEEILEKLKTYQKIFFTGKPLESLSEIKQLQRLDKKANLVDFEFFNLPFQAAQSASPFIALENAFGYADDDHEKQIDGFQLIKNISQSVESPEFTLYLLYESSKEWEKIKKKIEEKNLSLPPNTQIIQGYLSKGFYLKGCKSIFFPLTEFHHRYKIRRQKMRSTLHFTAPEVQEFHYGDYVVHYQNGVGKYMGMIKKENHLGQESDFFHLQYADNTTLFVPLTQAYLLTKFVGVKDEKPAVNKLGSSKWKKQLANTEKSIMGYAADLLEVQAKREVKKGFSFPKDSQDTFDFEEEFPYIPTQDQLGAIQDIKEDMQQAQSMDRLVCGDVGFGKTEVAMRAAFKAVVDGQKQVAVLVPTTILAVQHYETFYQRMQNFPLNIALLSRFQSPKESRIILEKLSCGQIDILIGTHRLTSNDVIFHDLGLLIIDEEQRFGVRVKEKLKKIKTQLDCLTLSATPIPRTLYSSLIGIKNMSLIQTPPQDRLPIKTFIYEKDQALIKEAIQRELTRDGQVYYIHNRVESIYKEAQNLQKLFPHTSIAIAHGQLSATEIEKVFYKFKQGEVDILVATTIVESGLDIPQANTLIVDRADRYGLADLYQLRGRVGRWNKPAYAYLLVPKGKGIRELASKRLQALLEASSYGGGMKIAMHDLEIRGAGDLLGTSQSGHISNVGFHLYCRLLKQTIESLQGKSVKALYHTKIDTPFDAKLPNNYIQDSSLRLQLYQRLGEAESIKDIDNLIEEIQDRFGAYPKEVSYLHYITRIRLLASQKRITLIKLNNFSVELHQKVGKQTQKKSFLLPKITSASQLEKEVKKLLSRF